MAFSMTGATAPSENNKDKAKPGRHLCIVRNLREIDGRGGHGFWADFEVVSGPSGEGFQFSWGVYPESARGNAKLTTAQVQDLERGKIQKIVAACLGYGTENQKLVDDKLYSSIVRTVKGEVSPAAGRHVVVDAVPYTSSKGATVYYTILPSLTHGVYGVAATPTPAAPAAPSAPTFPPAGWRQHPEDPAYYFNANGDVKTAHDLLGA